MVKMVKSMVDGRPLPGRPPTFRLEPGTRLYAKVSAIQRRHPEWEAEAIRCALLRQGFAASLRDIKAVMKTEREFEGMLPLRVVKARLGMYS